MDGTDDLIENEWRLTNGDLMTYIPWPSDGSEPDGGTNQNCLIIVSTDATAVHDYPCSLASGSNVRAVCEFDGTIQKLFQLTTLLIELLDFVFFIFRMYISCCYRSKPTRQ